MAATKHKRSKSTTRTLPKCLRKKCRAKVKRRGRKHCSVRCGNLAIGKAERPGLAVKLEGAYRLGAIDSTAAAVVGMHRNGLSKLLAREPALAEKVEMWKAAADQMVLATLYAKAVSGDVTAMIWWTKNRLGWKDRTEHAVTGKSLAELLAEVQEDAP